MKLLDWLFGKAAPTYLSPGFEERHNFDASSTLLEEKTGHKGIDKAAKRLRERASGKSQTYIMPTGSRD